MKLFLTFIFSLGLSWFPALPLYSQDAIIKALCPVRTDTIDISDQARKIAKERQHNYNKITAYLETYPYEERGKAFKKLPSDQQELFRNTDEENMDPWNTEPIGCSWYCGAWTDTIFASSVLPASPDFDYEPANLHDFSLETAWIEGVPGYGVGESITFYFPVHYPVTTFYIYNGYMRTEKAWKENSRVKQLKLYVNDVPYALLNLEDIPGEQTFMAGEELKGKGEFLALRFEITDVYKGSKYDDTAISEINFNGTGVHCFAPGTLIATPDGNIPIEQLKEGDSVLSYNPASRMIETSTVLATARQHHHNLYELDFGKRKVITTEDHPFFYEGHYYSVEPNDKYGVTTHKLEKQQKVHYLNKGKINSLTLKSIKKLKVCEDTYTITGLDKNSLFFANGLCVSVE